MFLTSPYIDQAISLIDPHRSYVPSGILTAMVGPAFLSSFRVIEDATTKIKKIP